MPDAETFLTPSFQTFQIAYGDSTVLGYSIEDAESNSGHLLQIGGSLNPNELRAKMLMLKIACHFLVDIIPASGMEEMLEKATEIRDYYCSLANWSTPAIAETSSIAVNPVVVSYEREPFSYIEE